MVARRQALLGLVVVLSAGGCSSSDDTVTTPGLADRDTVLTTVKPARQDLSNTISLNGKVAINPVFGIVAPADGELRWVSRTLPKEADDTPVWVASVWHDGIPRRVEIPAGSIFAGRLMADHATVTKGMPIVSATHAGYGITADVDSAQAYRISGAVQQVKAQIKNGPGPFRCTALGTIAALPAGTVPVPVTTTPPTPAASGAPQPVETGDPGAGSSGSEPTGLRLVCVPPAGVKLINGADVTIELVTDKATGVLVLPVEAVAGSQGKGKVDLVVGDDQTRKTIDVTLGISDGKVIEIKKGLKGDETIAVPGPNLPAPESTQ
ncbi:efflux RND transporter periplasmic adaptor subunit [Actinoplanes sp. NPDC020271]|uniref:efflux RND transporter periplasmic adaptor subunit n=1 Tax=Actinoplanes sp. NPDC020271 TaxID=3363896 RepID=UPI0037AABF11